MAAKTKTGKSTFGKVCGILVDIFIVPIMIVAFICALIMSSAKANGKVPSILGNSIVTVRSGSMAPAYNIGDVLIIDQSIDKGDIKVGENIEVTMDYKGLPFTVEGKVVRTDDLKGTAGVEFNNIDRLTSSLILYLGMMVNR